MDSDFDLAIVRLKAVAEPTRMRLISLCAQGERSVTELTEILGQSQPRISRHLKLLVAARLLENHRDGHWVYFRAPTRGADGRYVRQVLALLPQDCETISADSRRAMGAAAVAEQTPVPASARAFNRAVVDLALAGSLGRVLDIGSGDARILKLLAGSATEVIGLDVNPERRRIARKTLSGVSNCSIRAGDMYRLPFGAAQFQTVILDEVLVGAEFPVNALIEARRVLGAHGRVVILEQIRTPAARSGVEKSIAKWAAAAEFRVGRSRPVPSQKPEWLFFSGVAADHAERVA